MSMDHSAFTTMRCCCRLLDKAGIRHHLDPEQGVIRTLFVTRDYRNPRGERFAIVTLDAPDGSRCLRATIASAFVAGPDLGDIFLAARALVDDPPSVSVRDDAATGSISLSAVLLFDSRGISGAGICLLLDHRWSAPPSNANAF